MGKLGKKYNYNRPTVEEAKSIVHALYKSKEYIGHNSISEYFKNLGFSISEGSLRRLEPIVKPEFKLVYIGGRECHLFNEENAFKILEYFLTTSWAQHREDWIDSIPGKREELKNKRKLNKAIKDSIPYEDRYSYLVPLSITKLKYGISEVPTKKILKRLGIDLVKGKIPKDKLNLLLEYIENNVPKDPKARRLFLATQTSLDEYGTTGFGAIPEMASKTHNTKIKNREKLVEEKEKELGSKLIDFNEANKIVCRNNSTIIDTMKLLNLPLYKFSNKYYYDIKDIHFLKKFFDEKTGLKGQLARAFEKYLNDNNYYFNTEKTFEGLRDIYPLRCDYYLPYYNCVVEVQGMQHFIPIDFSHTLTEEQTLEEFKALQRRDNIKKEYFISHNINYYYVIYKEDIYKFKEFVEDIKIK